MKIAIVGLGYVGLPLAMRFARSCVSVLGIDVDPRKVELLNNGDSYIKHIEQSAIAELVSSEKFFASTDFSRIKEVEAVIICVPTPLTKNREPDISFVHGDRRDRLRRICRKGLWLCWNQRLIRGPLTRTCAPSLKKDRG